MPEFKQSFIVNASLESVAAFHSHSDALKTLNPPGMIVQLHRVDPMGEGSISKFTLWFGPVPIHWTAEHSDVSINGFTDRMIEGPARSWVHTHRYEDVSSGTTEVTDHIYYEHKAGLMGLFTRLLFSSLSLKILFGYRAWATRRAVAKNHNAAG